VSTEQCRRVPCNCTSDGSVIIQQSLLGECFVLFCSPHKFYQLSQPQLLAISLECPLSPNHYYDQGRDSLTFRRLQQGNKHPQRKISDNCGFVHDADRQVHLHHLDQAVPQIQLLWLTTETIKSLQSHVGHLGIQYGGHHSEI